MTIQQETVETACEGEKEYRRRRLLRAVNSDLYDIFTERLEEHRIHSYDVQLIVEEVGDISESDTVILKVLYGDDFANTFEKTLLRSELTNQSEAMQTYLSEFIAACEEGLILDYRKFMQPHT